VHQKVNDRSTQALNLIVDLWRLYYAVRELYLRDDVLQLAYLSFKSLFNLGLVVQRL
jgi:hypothetical protein